MFPFFDFVEIKGNFEKILEYDESLLYKQDDNRKARNMPLDGHFGRVRFPDNQLSVWGKDQYVWPGCENNVRVEIPFEHRQDTKTSSSTDREAMLRKKIIESRESIKKQISHSSSINHYNSDNSETTSRGTPVMPS